MSLINKITSINKMNLLLYIGWFCIALFFSWGNTSLGFLFLMIHSIIYLIINRKEINFNLLFKFKTNIILISLLIWTLISAVFAYHKSLALASTLGFIILISITLFETKILINFKKFIYKLLLPIMTLGITIASSYIIYNYFSSTLRRATGVFSNVNDTGTLLIISLILIISYFEYLNNNYKYLVLIPGLLNLLALLLTFSRGAFIGFIAGLAIYNLRSKKHLVIFILIFILIFSFIYSNPKLNKRFIKSLTIEDNMDRINIWMSSLKMIKAHPIQGVGPGNFPKVYPSYRWVEKKSNRYKSFAHNIFLNMAVETGIVGFILFTILIILVLSMGIKLFNNNPIHRGIVAALIAVLIHNQFDCTVLKFEVGVVFWALIGLILAIYQKENPEKSNWILF